MSEESLYVVEQSLLNELVKSEGKSEKKYQEALKRQITRINKVMESLDE